MMKVAIRKCPKQVVAIDRLRYYVTKIVGWRTSESTERSDFFNSRGILYKRSAVGGLEA